MFSKMAEIHGKSSICFTIEQRTYGFSNQQCQQNKPLECNNLFERVLESPLMANKNRHDCFVQSYRTGSWLLFVKKTQRFRLGNIPQILFGCELNADDGKLHTNERGRRAGGEQT